MANENKTVATNVAAADFLATVEPEARRAEGQVICDLMAKVSGCPPVMWGPTMVGFGNYHYRYDSGREGAFFRIGFSPRKAQLTLYVIGDYDNCDELLSRLGKHKIGKSCLYINKLADVDLTVLAAMVQASWTDMAKRYPL